METAENIARSCKLIQPNFKVMAFAPALDEQKNASTESIGKELEKWS